MKTIAFVALTEAITVIVSAAVLLRIDGWFYTLLAILLIMQLLLNTSLILTSGLLNHANHTKPTTKKEE